MLDAVLWILLVEDFNFKLLTSTCLGNKFIESKFGI